MATETKFVDTAKALLKGGMSREDVSQSIDLMLKSVNGGFPVATVKALVEMEIDNFKLGQDSLAGEVRDYINTTEGNITRTEIQRELHLPQ